MILEIIVKKENENDNQYKNNDQNTYSIFKESPCMIWTA